MYRIQIDGAQNSSRMCMCFEFVIQVLKQKSAHVSLPVGMVKAQIFRGNSGAFFVRNFVPRKRYFVPTSFCRRATLTNNPPSKSNDLGPRPMLFEAPRRPMQLKSADCDRQLNMKKRCPRKGNRGPIWGTLVALASLDPHRYRFGIAGTRIAGQTATRVRTASISHRSILKDMPTSWPSKRKCKSQRFSYAVFPSRTPAPGGSSKSQF